MKVRPAMPSCLECHRIALNGATHIKCRKKLSLDFTYSAWDYNGVVRRAILKMKYNFAFGIAKELAEKFIEKIKRDAPFLPRSAILIPIPLHKSRQNWRGFNQAGEMGKTIAQKMGWQYEADTLKRTKKTNPQAELKRKERAPNLFGAFSLNPRFTAQDLPYVLFDDVLTTGSTLKEACKVFKQGGTRTVWGLTIAA